MNGMGLQGVAPEGAGTLNLPTWRGALDDGVRAGDDYERKA